MFDRAEIEDQEFVEAKAQQDGIKAQQYSITDVQATDLCKYLALSGSRCGYIFEISVVFVIGTIAMVSRSYTQFTFSEDYNHSSQKDPYQLFYMLGSIVAGLVLVGLLGLQFVGMGFHVSKNFHTKITKSVLRSPMSFFDTNPVGTILTRFA